MMDNRVGLISAHGSLDEGRYFYLPDGLSLHCLCATKGRVCNKLFKSFVDTIHNGGVEKAVKQFSLQDYNGGQAVPDMFLGFLDPTDSTRDKISYETFGIFPDARKVSELLVVPGTSVVLKTCMTSPVPNCRNEMYEAVGDVRRKLQIDRSRPTVRLSEVIRRIAGRDLKRFPDGFPKRFIVHACRSCSAVGCPDDEVKFLNGNKDRSKLADIMDENGAFPYGPARDRLAAVLKPPPSLTRKAIETLPH